MIDRIRKAIGYRLDKNFWFKENIREGYKTYVKTGKTAEDVYQAFVKMYCDSNGQFAEDLNTKLKSTNPPIAIHETLSGVAGTYTKADFAKVNTEMNEKGYAHFEKKLPKELCDRLTQFALTTTSITPPKY